MPGRPIPIGDSLLAQAARSSPVIGQTLARYRQAPVSELLGTVRAGPQAGMQAGMQSREDLWQAVEAEAAITLGQAAAAEVAAELRADPIVPTSNHFGVETTAESTQSTLLFALRPDRPATAKYVVILGFSSISMNNWSFPRGLRLYDPRHGQLDGLPQRLPVLPDRVKQYPVATAPAFDEDMVRRASQRVRQSARSGEVTPFAAQAADELLAEVFAAPEILALPHYQAQSPVVNARLWRRMFREPDHGGQLVQLCAEAVCARLLTRDMSEESSLIHRLFFDPVVRGRLLAALDGQRACWRGAELHQAVEQLTSSRTSGTMFFWGLSDRGHRIPLVLTDGQAPSGQAPSGQAPRLCGVDRGSLWQVEFTPEAVAAGLAAGRLLPSLYTCFALLAFARALACVGGYYQVEYLPVMQAATAHALSAGHQEAADLVSQVPTQLSIAGLQGLVRELPDGRVLPAGPVELAGMGGVSAADLEAFTAMPVGDAYLVAFTELFDVLFPDADLPAGWLNELAIENYRQR